MKEELERRVTAIRALLTRHKLHAMLVQNRVNSLYFSGFPCSNSLLLITRQQAFFLTDFRYILKAKESITHLEVRQIPQRALDELALLIRKLRISRLGFEESISYSEFTVLKSAFGANVEFIPSGSLISGLRRVKSAGEIKTIARNQRLNEKIYMSVSRSVQIGETESSIRNRILREMINEQCEEAFDSIIATGKNSALPHAIPSSAKVRKGSFLLFDMGVKKNYYHSDMTRTISVGERLPAMAKEIYEVVLQAQMASLAAVGPGTACNEIDAIARNIISDAGYGEYFGHGLGHGVGLEIHEGPTLNPRSADVLEPGMVITIEPGIYIPELGGVRIEDLVLVTESGYRNLTSLPKNLFNLPV